MVHITLAFWKDQSVPVTVLLIIAFVSLLLSLLFCSLSISTFAKEFRRVKSGHDGDECYLYMTNPSILRIKAGSDSYCEFIIVAQSFVLILVTSLIIAILIMLFLRFKVVIDLNLIIFPILAVVSFLFSFSASIILTDGFAKTCTAVEEVFFNQVKCIDVIRYIKSDYSGIQNVVFSWIETGSIGVVVIIACVYMGLRIPRRASHDPLQ